MDIPELNSLLNQRRLSFHWNAAGKTWWLIGQAKGSNQLISTNQRPAETISIAQADAVRFILDNFTDAPAV